LETGLSLRARDKSHSKALLGVTPQPPQALEWKLGIKATDSPDMGSFWDTSQHESMQDHLLCSLRLRDLGQITASL